MGKKINKSITIIAIVIAVVLILPIICGFLNSLNQAKQESAKAVQEAPEEPEAPSPSEGSLSHRLAMAGWIFFGSDSCGWCQRQKQELGDGFEAVFIETSTPEAGALIQKHGVQIQGVPHWFNINSREEMGGFQQKEKLLQQV